MIVFLVTSLFFLSFYSTNVQGEYYYGGLNGENSDPGSDYFGGYEYGGGDYLEEPVVTDSRDYQGSCCVNCENLGGGVFNKIARLPAPCCRTCNMNVPGVVFSSNRIGINCCKICDDPPPVGGVPFRNKILLPRPRPDDEGCCPICNKVSPGGVPMLRNRIRPRNHRTGQSSSTLEGETENIIFRHRLHDQQHET